jgi:hypothetical protein
MESGRNSARPLANTAGKDVQKEISEIIGRAEKELPKSTL